MFRNYLKTAIRNLKKRKSFSLINIIGLAIGMAISFLMLLYVVNEVTYDRFNENSQNIYRYAAKLEVQERELNIASMPAPFAPALLEQFPEIKSAARIRTESPDIISIDEEIYEERRIHYADSGLFDIFTIKILEGNPEKMLDAPFSLVITDEMAEKYFKGEDPLGRTIKFDDQHVFTITGVVQKMPENSHFKFNMLASLSSLDKIRGDLDLWMGFNYHTYIELETGTPVEVLKDKTYELLMSRQPPQFQALGVKMEISLQPLTSIHLHSHTEGELESPGNPAYIRILLIIALFILIIACINFMNLSTAQSVHRANEVGMRKVLGSHRAKLISQFLGESLLLSFISLVIAALLIQFLLPVFNNLVFKNLTFNPFQDWMITLGFLGITIFVGLMAGAYPALFLSSFLPIDVLKSKLRARKGHRFFRNGLVSFQYIISIALICCTFVIFLQIRHVKNYNLGFDKERVVVIQLHGQQIRQNIAVLKNELLKLPNVVNAAVSSLAPGMGRSETIFSFEEKGEDYKPVLPFMDVDEDYIETMDMQIVQGRNFSKDIPSDNRAMIINETLLKHLGWEDPLGKMIKMTDVDENRNFIEVPYTVIGVIRDFHFESLHQELRGQLMRLPGEESRISVKLRPENISGTIAQMENVWKGLEPNNPMEYSFLDDAFDRLYRNEERLGKIFIYFSLITVFIACLGLFGLASFAAEQRTKEIGIRKVLGASVPNVVLLLSRDFTKWVILANAMAWPIAYFSMSKWLQSFAYRMNFGVWIFILSGAIALITALFSVITKAVKAASADPVNSLRYE
jgi:putative ABC transport system permease protein